MQRSPMQPLPTTAPAGPLRSRPRLLALAIGLPLLEATLLLALAPASSLPLATHVTAPEPFGVFHDLRWILVYHPGALAFAGEALLLLVFRTLLTAALVRESWPVDVERPPARSILAGSAGFTLVTALLLSPWAALLFGAGVISLSWLFFVAVPLTVFIALLVHHGAADRDWWRRTPPLRSVGWLLLAFTALTVAGAVTTAVPAALQLPAVAATGLFNAWAWVGVTHSVVCRKPSPRLLPVAPVGLFSLVAVTAVGTTMGFQLGRPSSSTARPPSPPPLDGKPVLVVTGFGSSWDGRPQRRFPEFFDERRFSYRGTSHTGPVAYEPEDTLESLPGLVRELDHQVRGFHRERDAEVSLVAESEGALLAKAYLTSHPEAPVDRLVMLSPLVRPGRVYYPPEGEDGWGVAASWELRGLSALIRGLTPLEVSTDTALFRSVNELAPALREMISCPTPGVEELALTPLADAVASSEFESGSTRVIHLADFHGGLLGNGEAQRIVAEELLGREPDGSRTWSLGDRVVRALAAGWQTPELAVSVNPAWEARDDSSASCPDVRRRLRDHLGGAGR